MANNQSSSLELNNDNILRHQNPPNATSMDESDKPVNSKIGLDAALRESIEVANEQASHAVNEPGGDGGNGDVNDERCDGCVEFNAISTPDDEAGEDVDGEDNECGPWPTNSTFEWEHEPFQTYQIKVAQLCRELGYGDSVDIIRMNGGGFNRIIGLTFPGGQNPDLILRIPRILQENQYEDLKAQVAVVCYLSKFDNLHVPKILGYDFTIDNALQQMYVLQKKLPGVCAGDIFYDLPLSEKLQITTLVAEMLIELESVSFDGPGRPVGVSAMPRKLHTVLEPSNVIEIAPFRYNPMMAMDPLLKQPLKNLLMSLLDLQGSKFPNFGKTQMVERLKVIAEEMETASLMRISDTENVIWHWDLSGNNVLIQSSDSASDDTKAVPQTQKACKHSVEFKVANDASPATRHTIQVHIEDASATSCNHKIEVSVTNSSGTKFRHAVSIEDDQIEQKSTLPPVTSGNALSTNAHSEVKEHCVASAPKNWAISGLIDWDDALSVPLVLSRKPPSWLWFEEKGRDWSQNRDDPLPRDLTQEELLIKAHFDQIMEKARPGYIEDTYHRGVWLRKLARFGLEGFGDSSAWKRYEDFDKEWAMYYASLGF